MKTKKKKTKKKMMIKIKKRMSEEKKKKKIECARSPPLLGGGGCINHGQGKKDETRANRCGNFFTHSVASTKNSGHSFPFSSTRFLIFEKKIFFSSCRRQHQPDEKIKLIKKKGDSYVFPLNVYFNFENHSIFLGSRKKGTVCRRSNSSPFITRKYRVCVCV